MTDDYIYSTNGPDGMGDFSMDDIPEMLRKTRSIKLAMAVERSRTYFALLGERCSMCNRPVEYEEGPPERVTVCRHVYETIKTRYGVQEEQSGQLGPFPHMQGILGGFLIFVRD